MSNKLLDTLFLLGQFCIADRRYHLNRKILLPLPIKIVTTPTIMKKVFFILALGAVSCFAISCGGGANNNKAAEQKSTTTDSLVVDSLTVATPVADSLANAEPSEPLPEVRIYADSYDGVVSIHREPSSKSPIIGKLKNGSDYLLQVGTEGKWIAVSYADSTGYVVASMMSKTPTRAVSVEIDTSKMQGAYWDGSGSFCKLIFDNGTYADLHETEGPICYGKYKAEGADIIFIPTVILNEDYFEFVESGVVVYAELLERNREWPLVSKGASTESSLAEGSHRSISREEYYSVRSRVRQRVK